MQENAANPSNSVQQGMEEHQQKMEIYKAKQTRVSTLFEKQRLQFEKALPNFLGVEVFIRTMLTSISKRPELMDCSGHSLLGSAMTAAQLGLRPDDVLGECYFIPFNNSKKGGKECQIIIGYKGYINLAMRSPKVASCVARCVYQLDEFDFEYGLTESLKHKPAMGVKREQKDITYFYAVVKFVGGGSVFIVMDRFEVEAVRDESKNYQRAKDKTTTIWHKNFDKMGMKTVLREIMKFVPLEPSAQTAIAYDKAADAGAQNIALTVLEDLPTEVAQDVTDEILEQGLEEEAEAEAAQAQAEQDERKQRAQAAVNATVNRVNQKIIPR